MLISLILAASIGQTGGYIGEQEFWQGYNAAGGKNGGGEAYIDGLIRNGQLPPLPEPDHTWHMKTDASGARILSRCAPPGETFDPNSLPADFYPPEARPATAGGTYITDPPDAPGGVPQIVNPTAARSALVRRMPVAIAFAKQSTTSAAVPIVSPVPIRHYATDMAFPSGGSRIVVKPATNLAAKSVIAKELATYPAGFLASIGLRQVVIGDSMSWNGRTEGGFTDVPSGTIFLISGSDLAYTRRCVHHEIGHILDARLGSTGWPTGGGYISAYARKNPGEDRAEVFADYMINPSLIVRQSQADPIVKAKVDWFKARLASRLPAFSQRGY